MYTPTQNYGLAMPSYGDEADIGVINDMVTSKVDELLFQNRTISAPPFETTEAYTEGDLVVYENVLYRFTADKAAGAWDSSKVVQTSLADEIESKGSGASALSDLTDTDIDTPANGEVLTWDGTAWVNAEGTPAVTKTATGNPIEISDGADAPLVKCVTQIQGYQDLHGYDKPWVGGAGKNKLPMTVSGIKSANTSGTWSGNAYTLNGITFTVETDGDDNVTGIKANGTSTADWVLLYIPTFTLTAGNYILNGCANGELVTYRIDMTPSGTTNLNGDTAFSVSEDSQFSVRCIIRQSGYTANNVMLYPMIRLSTVTDPTFAPYSNICPITAYTEGEIEVSDGDGNTTTHTTTYPSAIYRGSEDVVNGSETHDIVKVVFDGSSDEQWGRYTTGSASAFTMKISIPKMRRSVTNLKANYLQTINTGATWGNYDSWISCTADGLLCTGIQSITTVEDWRTYLSTNNLEVVYELATPTTTSVTPTNLPIKSLSGYTHIESTTGEMEVEYITDGYQPLVDLIQESQHVYATTEQVVGKWVDGSTIYERTIDLGADREINTYGYDITAFIPSDIDRSISCEGQCDTYKSSIPLLLDYTSNNQTWHIYSGILTIVRHLTIRYTKSTATTLLLSKGSTEGLKADLSEEKKKIEELPETEENTVKKAQSEGDEVTEETKEEADETEGNADEVQNKTIAE